MLKRVLNISGLMAALALVAVVSGCGSDAKKATYKVGTVAKIDSAVLDGGNVKKLLVSKDNKLAYVLTSKGAVFCVDLKDGINSLHNKANYKKLTLKDEGKDGTTAGKDKLNTEEVNPADHRDIALSSKGVVVKARYRTAAGAAEIGALAYFEGANQLPTYAWTNQATHGDATVIDPAQAFADGANKLLVVNHDGKEFIVAEVADHYVSAVEIGDDKKFTGYFSINGGNHFGDNLRMVAQEGSTADAPGKLFFINQGGISSVGLDKLGTTVDVPGITPTSEEAADKWAMKVAGGVTANNEPTEALLLGDRVYIALSPRDPVVVNMGGVAVYNIKDAKTTAPDVVTWNKVLASNLSVHQGKVRAMVNRAWIDIKEDGTLGQESFSLATLENNKLKDEKNMSGNDLAGKTFFKFSTAGLFGKLAQVLNNVLVVGNDLLFSMSSEGDGFTGEQFTIHFQDKEIEIKEAKE